MKATQNILFLSLHTFSLMGGIEKVNRSFSKVLADLKAAHKIKGYQLLSMYDKAVDEQYAEKAHFKGCAGKKLGFAFTSLFTKCDTVILSHINLLIFALIIKKIRPQTKVILIAHGIEVWRALPRWKVNFLKTCQIWAVSKYTAAKLIEMHQIPTIQIQILNNCLDPFFEIPKQFNKPENLLQKYKLTNDQPVIYTLSRLSSSEKYKGYDLVIASLPAVLKIFPNAHYVLAGKADALEQQRLLDLIALHHLEKNVTLAGFINDDEVLPHYLLADVFVMPSTGEGFGISFIEAAACGCSVIGGNQDGSTDALLNGEIGKLIDPTHQTALTNAIVEQLKMGKSNTRAHQIQSTTLANFSFAQYKNKIDQLLN